MFNVHDKEFLKVFTTLQSSSRNFTQQNHPEMEQTVCNGTLSCHLIQM